MRPTLLVLLALLATHRVAVSLPVHAAKKPVAPARADWGPAPVQLLARLDVVALGAEAVRGLEGHARLPAGLLARMVASGQMRMLQSAEVLTVTGVDSQILIGRKNPFVYYDPKVAQFQVQYIDTGVKMWIRAKANPRGSLDLDVSTDVAPLEATRTQPDPTGVSAFPQVDVMLSRATVTGIPFGEGLILVRAHGQTASTLMTLLGVTTPPPASGRDLAVVITVMRP